MRALTFALGVTADAALGDPPTAVHPVGLIGRAAALLRACAPGGEVARGRYGLGVATMLPLVAAAGAVALRNRARALHPLAGVAIEVALLDSTCALRTLLDRATEVHDALARDAVEEARALLSRHLVSRDTSSLTPSEVAGATIESVAENLSDGVIAPWLWYALAGLPGAVVYRTANTMDALWGYHSPEFEALGRGVARLDDALNLLPARLTALAIVTAAALPGSGASASSALATWRADARLTESPNAGHPMAAMAGALGVSLTKHDAYTLGATPRAPDAADIARAIQLARVAARLVAAGLFGALLATKCTTTGPATPADR